MNLLQSVAKMLKSSKFMAQLHCNRWSDIADCLTILRRFPVRSEIPMYSAALVQKWLNRGEQLATWGSPFL